VTSLHLLPTPEPLSQSLAALFERYRGQSVAVGTLVDELHGRGFAILLILFALPLCVPIPKPPPVDTIFGLPLFYLCLQMIMGADHPRLPEKIRRKELSGNMLCAVMARSLPYLQKFELLFKPRWVFLDERTMTRVCGDFGMVMTCSVLIPFPFSNTLPSVGMIIMSMGLMTRDTLATLAGALFGIVWIFILTGMAIGGAEMIARAWG